MDILNITPTTILANHTKSLEAAKGTHAVHAERVEMLTTMIGGEEDIKIATSYAGQLAEMVCEVHTGITHSDAKTKKRLRENFRKSWKKSFAGTRNSAHRFQLDFACLPSSTSFELSPWAEKAKAKCKDCQTKETKILELENKLQEALVSLESVNLELMTVNRHVITIEDIAAQKSCKLGDLKKAING